MGELRKDYILDRYVLMAGERAKRPDQFKKSLPIPVSDDIDFFARGNENMTPPEIYRYPEGAEDWKFRVFPNKFAAVSLSGKKDIETADDYFTYSDAYGNHEVIVDVPELSQDIADSSIDDLALLFDIFIQRIKANLMMPGIKYVSLFKNSGKEAGTSIQHSHCQLISLNHVPATILEKEKAVSRHPDPYGFLEIEKRSDRRCFENDSFIAFTPYASRFPFEIWLYPKRHFISIIDMEENEKIELAELMKKTILKLKEISAPYNISFNCGIKDMRFHIEIMPRLATWAGFEMATGEIINIMPPEKAAEFYRG